MKKTATLGLFFLTFIACSKNEVDDTTQEAHGKIWLSGGLAVCAEQIRLDNGDVLIANLADVKTFKTDDRVIVKYNQTSVSKSCSPSLDCKIISIKKE